MDAKSLNEALIKQHPKPGQASQQQSKEELLTQLFTLQTGGVDTTTVLDNLRSDQLDPLHFALISFLDIQVTERVNEAQLPEEVAGKLRGVVAAVMRVAISDGVLAMTKSPIISITEALLTLTYGWTDLRGKALESTEQKLNDAIQSLIVATGAMEGGSAMIDARNNILDLLEADIVRFVSNERDRIKKLEQRLADSVSGLLTAERSRQQTVSMLNDRMVDKLLPTSIVTFLQGVWFDSLQLIATRQGTDSDEWYRAVQLTETLISTVQQETENEPAAEASNTPNIDAMLEQVALDVEIEKVGAGQEPALPDPEPAKTASATNQKLYRIIEHLPQELRSCLVAIEHDQNAIANALAAIEDTHIQVMKGDRLEVATFSLIGNDAVADNETRVSQSLLAPVKKLNPGDWFVFHQNDARHIKVTLRADDSQHLIFTNRNGSSALQTSFEEFAYLMSSGTVKSLPQPGELLKSVRRNLMACLKAKAKEDEIATARQERQAAESLAQSIESTQFVLMSVPKKSLESDEPIQLHPARLAAAIKANQRSSNLVYVDETNSLNDLTVDDVIKFALGTAIEVEDDMPVGMADFKAAVERMRSHTKLVRVDTDD